MKKSEIFFKIMKKLAESENFLMKLTDSPQSMLWFHMPKGTHVVVVHRYFLEEHMTEVCVHTREDFVRTLNEFLHQAGFVDYQEPTEPGGLPG